MTVITSIERCTPRTSSEKRIPASMYGCGLPVDSVGVSPDHPHPLGRRLAAPSPVPLAGHIIGFAVRVDKTGTVRSLLLPWTVPC